MKPLFSEETGGFFNETQLSEANNLKVTIGALEVVSRIIPEA